ncbi:sulfite reductase (NADPH) hemoprotein beta-component [Nannocystis exedens]|uniref:Sulfite reductase (NADPH) hemoprotein beta-component n=1 Tax=Nannocystis exedens TaxID=54 RepID=A0A1I2HGD1_9BACT|nr:nitrite/sulfite reductase [Nannocystis exedens]PCC70378.1 ferredoxin-nitrite reductase [Nannocystis exedens]SFF28772.1 sulfite reductase (NADPH) hemoprotein beta-component [Nannocystis exedens]
MSQEARYDTHFSSPADVEEFVAVLERFERGEISSEDFRTFRLKRGVYGQRQMDVNMLRVKFPGGIMSAAQLRTAAGVAREYTQYHKGHITTRQNIQFHFVKLADMPAVMARFDTTGATTREACGNTVRNVTGCPYAGVSGTEAFDITPYMHALVRMCLREEWANNLPRKFKMAFEGCTHEDHAQTAINDVGFRAKIKDGVRGFEVFVAGGLSTTPRPAYRLHDFIPADEVLARTEAIIRLFDKHGNRKNRARARLKYVMKTLGEEGFVAAYEEEVAKIVAAGTLQRPIELPPEETAPAWNDRALAGPRAGDDDPQYKEWLRTVDPQKQPGFAAVTIKLDRGDISADQFDQLAELAETFTDGTLRAGNRQNLIVRWVRTEYLPHLFATLQQIGLADLGSNTIHDVVSCPGADSCNLAVTHSMSLAKHLTRFLKNAGKSADSVELARSADIKISGCPNSCGQHHVAAIGFHGTVRHVGDGKQVPEYQLHLGGGFDADGVQFGRHIVKIPARRAGEALLRLLDLYRDEREDGEDARAFFRRVTKEDVVEALGDALLDSQFTNLREDDVFDLGQERTFDVAIGRGECAA